MYLAYKGHFESFCQFALQLYIIFTKADRKPSWIQLVTIPASLVMMVRLLAIRVINVFKVYSIVIRSFDKKSLRFLMTSCFADKHRHRHRQKQMIMEFSDSNFDRNSNQKSCWLCLILGDVWAKWLFLYKRRRTGFG